MQDTKFIKVHQSSPPRQPRQPRHNISKLAERHLINNWSEDRTLVIVTIRRARASLPGNLLSGLTATIPAQIHMKSFEHKHIRWSWNKAFAACIRQSVSLFLCPWWWDDHHHYISLYIIIYHYISLYIIIYHYISLYIIIYHYISLYIIIYHYISLYIIIYHYISLYIIIYHYISLYIIIYHYISLYIIIYHYISLSWWSDFVPPDLQFPQFFPFPKHPRYWRKVPIRSKRNKVGSMGRTKATKATSTKEAKVTKTST